MRQTSSFGKGVVKRLNRPVSSSVFLAGKVDGLHEDSNYGRLFYLWS